LMRAREDGNTRSIGVCNSHEHHLDDLTSLAFFTPAVNQIELHPLLNQKKLRDVNAGHGIVTEAYGPLGVGALLDNPAVTAIAEQHGKTPAQVLIRWSLQLGNVVIPRSSSPERIAANIDVFGFELTAEQMDSLNGLDNGTRFRPDPETYTGGS
jgi:2,5-diketo-D-gluconate reductase A